MILKIATDSPVPPYEQIRGQVVDMITAGVLREGVQLPPIRQLARDLKIASGTVARAYRELEAEGVLKTEGRRGSFVRRARPADRDRVENLLNEAAHDFAVKIRQLGIDPEAALDSVRKAYLDVSVGPTEAIFVEKALGTS